MQLTTPSFTAGALIGIALPLFVVTMAGQNIPGMGVLASFGFHPPLRPVLVTTGLASVVAAPLGGLSVNLAAISAALVSGPDGGPDPARRWPGGLSNGVTAIVLGLTASLVTALVAAAPPLLVEAAAGLALLGALAGALSAALAEPERREAALITFVVAASGITVAGIGGAFWGLVAGLAFSGAAPPRRARVGAADGHHAALRAPALVTGASSGIGEAIARSLAARGARVACVARREDRVSALAEELGGVAIAADVTDEQAMRDAADRAAGRLGGLDCVCAVAGASSWRPSPTAARTSGGAWSS